MGMGTAMNWLFRKTITGTLLMKNNVTFKPIILVVAVMMATPACGMMGRLKSLFCMPRKHRLNQVLFEAVQGNDHPRVQKLLAAGADPNARYQFQQTPLLYAAWFGHAEVGRLLIGADATIDAQTYYRNTPLHGAAQKGHAGVAELLIDAGADPEACSDVIPAIDTNHNRTPLQLGAVRTQLPNGQPLPPDALRRLMQLGASLHDGHDPRMASWAWALQ